MSRGYERPARLYVGNLPDDVREREIEDLFCKYGRIRDIDLKTGRTSNGTAFAFVEFEGLREAEDAIDGRDGCRFGNLRLRVEFSGERGARRQGFRGGPPKRYVSPRTDYRVVITGLPPSASWQDLKDHMRTAGPVGYADSRDGRGIVEYETEEDMRYAIKKLDRSEFRNPFTHSVIRVRAEADKYNDREGSRSRSRTPRRSRSRSAKRSESPTKRNSTTESESPAPRDKSPSPHRGRPSGSDENGSGE